MRTRTSCTVISSTATARATVERRRGGGADECLMLARKDEEKEALERECEALRARCDALERNISCLFNTARAEIDRKDKEIERLRGNGWRS